MDKLEGVHWRATSMAGQVGALAYQQRLDLGLFSLWQRQLWGHLTAAPSPDIYEEFIKTFLQGFLQSHIAGVRGKWHKLQ